MGMKVGLKKNWNLLATRRWKPHDPAVINFDAIPECDGQTDGHVAYGNSLPDAVANSSRTNQFRNKLLDKHWSKQEMMYDYKAELAGILTRSNT